MKNILCALALGAALASCSSSPKNETPAAPAPADNGLAPSAQKTRVGGKGYLSAVAPVADAKEIPSLEWACEHKDTHACMRVLSYHHDHDHARFEEWVSKTCAQPNFRCKRGGRAYPAGKAPADPNAATVSSLTWASEPQGQQAVGVETLSVDELAPPGAEPVKSPIKKHPERRHGKATPAPAPTAE